MPAETEPLSATMEDYLEVINALAKDKGVARVGEIAEKMSVKSPSVNAALKLLSDRDLVVHEKYGYVSLTEDGKKIAVEVQNKHDVLFRFLTEFLMVDPAVADKEACCIEHSMSEDTAMRLVKFFKFLEMSPEGQRPLVLKNFEAYLKTGKRAFCDCEKRGK
jgi:DtxR family Mn-dependent transcriptional regulator